MNENISSKFNSQAWYFLPNGKSIFCLSSPTAVNIDGVVIEWSGGGGGYYLTINGSCSGGKA